MLFQFSVWPLDDPHLRDEMSLVREVLGECGLEYQMNRMSTNLEGSWDEVMEAIGKCHRKLRESHKRVLIQITVDDDGAI